MKQIDTLQEILPYVRAFQGKTFVIKLGGEVCRHSNLDEISRQVSLIHHIGIKVVLVHGGGPQMDELLKRLGIEKKVVHGRRITDDETLKAAKMVYAGLLSTDIVAILRKHGAKAVGLSGVDANLITANKRPPTTLEMSGTNSVTIDFQNVGDIEEVDCSIIQSLLSNNTIPVISSLGADQDGHVYNINADTIASKIAQGLGAEKLIVLSNVPGVLRDTEDPSSILSYVDIEMLRDMMAAGNINGGMLPKVTTCIEAVEGGVQRTHIIDGTRPSALLLELFVNEGCGTMIVSKTERLHYEQSVHNLG